METGTPQKKIWYASSLRSYPGNEPWLYDADKISWAQSLQLQWAEYKDEINQFIAEKDKEFISTAGFYKHASSKEGWSAMSFLFWGAKMSNEFDKKCPKTATFLKQIPGLVSISLSRLAPHASIDEHEGDTNAIMRCHLGIEVPGTLPACGFKVHGEERNWEEGKLLIFNDAYKHSAWNQTDKRRIIIIFDVVRPEFLKKKSLICAFILTRHASYIYDKVKLIRIMPVFIKTILFAGILGCVYVFKPVYNLFK